MKKIQMFPFKTKPYVTGRHSHAIVLPKRNMDVVKLDPKKKYIWHITAEEVENNDK